MARRKKQTEEPSEPTRDETTGARVIETIQDRITEEMTVDEKFDVIIDSLNGYEVLLLDLNRGVINIHEMLKPLKTQVETMANSFRKTESVASQNRSRTDEVVHRPLQRETRPPRSRERQDRDQPSQGYEFKWRPSQYQGVDEYCFTDVAPDHIYRLAKDRATQDGYKYFFSKNEKYIYRVRA